MVPFKRTNGFRGPCIFEIDIKAYSLGHHEYLCQLNEKNVMRWTISV